MLCVISWVHLLVEAGGERLEVLEVHELRGRVQYGMDDVVADSDWAVHNLEVDLVLDHLLAHCPVDQHGVGLDDVHLDSEGVSTCLGHYKQWSVNTQLLLSSLRHKKSPSLYGKLQISPGASTLAPSWLSSF